MQLLSLNVGLPRDVRYLEETISTAIFKEPVEGRVSVGSVGLEGDGQADLTVHGGRDKALYAYSIENYEFWRRELGRDDLGPCQFGENLTVSGMTEDVILIGERFQIGTALVEVTQPRSPCFKLALKMNSTTFNKQFLATCRVGFYLRVLEEGEMGAGDTIDRVEQSQEQMPQEQMPQEKMTVAEICDLLYHDRKNLVDTRRALSIKALAASWREPLEQRLEKLANDV